MYDNPQMTPVIPSEVSATVSDVPMQVVPDAPACNVVDVYVYPKDFQMVNDNKDSDCILVDIQFCVNAYERNTDDASRNASSRTGVVKKRLMLSRTQLLNDLLQMDSTTPITMVEATDDGVKAEADKVEPIKEEKSTSEITKRMRELAGLPSKGNWV